MGLGPPAVVGLERALAHSWAPGPEGIGGADLSASGETGGSRTSDGRGLPERRWMRDAGTPQQPSSSRPGNGTVGPCPRSNEAAGHRFSRNRRWGRRKRASSQVRGHRPARHAAPRRTRRPNGRENSRRVVDNRLLPLRHVVSVSPVAQPHHPRSTSPVAPAVRQTGPALPGRTLRGPGAPDTTGQPMYTGCGRPCGRHTTGRVRSSRAGRTREG